MTRHAALASFGSIAHGTPALRAWPGNTNLSFLLCSRIRQSLDEQDTQVLTVEQVRRSLNCWLQYHDLPPGLRDEKFQKELDDQRNYQQRNAQAKKSHTKTRIQLYLKLGIKVHKIKSCVQIQ